MKSHLPEEPSVRGREADVAIMPLGAIQLGASTYLSRKAQKSTVDGTPEEFAYIAGFFDGEGSVRIKEMRTAGRCYHSLLLKITNTELAVLFWIQSICGGRIRPIRRRNCKWKQAWDLTIINREKVKTILALLLPFLRVKRPQAEMGLAFLALGNLKWRSGAEEIAKRKALKCQIAVLNHRGAA